MLSTGSELPRNNEDGSTVRADDTTSSPASLNTLLNTPTRREFLRTAAAITTSINLPEELLRFCERENHPVESVECVAYLMHRPVADIARRMEAFAGVAEYSGTMQYDPDFNSLDGRIDDDVISPLCHPTITARALRKQVHDVRRNFEEMRFTPEKVAAVEQRWVEGLESDIEQAELYVAANELQNGPGGDSMYRRDLELVRTRRAHLAQFQAQPIPKRIECVRAVARYQLDLNIPLLESRAAEITRLAATIPTQSLDFLFKESFHGGGDTEEMSTVETDSPSNGGVSIAVPQKITPTDITDLFREIKDLLSHDSARLAVDHPGEFARLTSAWRRHDHKFRGAQNGFAIESDVYRSLRAAVDDLNDR